MEQKILLEKNRSKYSVDTDNRINLDLSGKSRLLPFDDVSTTLSLNEIYLGERDGSNKFRMIFSINPICSNVLFNYRTEIMRYEGSSACTVLLGSTFGTYDRYKVNTSSIDYLQAIRDTEYSHPDVFDNGIPYVYHCGLDIFNNHMLRNNDFVYVNKPGSDKDVFNTIKDYVRVTNNIDDTTGKTVSEDVTPGFTGATNKPIHLYQYDTILSMYDAYINRLNEKNGWYGFNNVTNIAIPNFIIDEKEVAINKIMNNNKACEMIDMYPDRSLYSFIPKVNKYRRRNEKNWDYCICYPKYKDSNLVSQISGIDSGITELNGGASIKIIEAKRTYSASGNDVVRFKTLFKHNLSVGTYVRLFYTLDSGSTLGCFNNRIKVLSVGDYEGNYKDRYFSVSFTSVSNKFSIDEESDEIVSGNTPVQFFYKRNVNGVDCEYYFRKFTRITKDNDGKTDLDSDINKLAYGENIYGDRLAQIVFTDDIDVEGLVDYRGKPLTEVYFTIIKRNAGHEEWYNNNVYNDENIEFSHCFGDITTGIDLPSEEYDYNVRKLHNVEFSAITSDKDWYSKEKIYIDRDGNRKPYVIESGITNENSYREYSVNDEYLGVSGAVYADIVEYSPVEDREVVLEIVQHRFNTAQRETLNTSYSGITYDDLVSDDYDYEYTSKSDTSKSGDGRIRGFVVSSYTVNQSLYVDDGNVDTFDYPGNINPEGYFYNPYTKIKIREVSEDINKVIGKVIKLETGITVTDVSYGGEELYNAIRFKTVINYNLMKNDILIIYNNETKRNYLGIIFDVISGTDITLIMDNMDICNEVANNTSLYTFIGTTEGVPSYATYLPSSHSFVWRPIIKMSELENDSELFNMPFSNGRHYIEKNILFFLKRQDPTGEFGLLNFDSEAKYKSILGGYRITGWDPIDLTVDKYNDGVLGDICY